MLIAMAVIIWFVMLWECSSLGGEGCTYGVILGTKKLDSYIGHHFSGCEGYQPPTWLIIIILPQQSHPSVSPPHTPLNSQPNLNTESKKSRHSRAPRQDQPYLNFMAQRRLSIAEQAGLDAKLNLFNVPSLCYKFSEQDSRKRGISKYSPKAHRRNISPRLKSKHQTTWWNTYVQNV